MNSKDLAPSTSARERGSIRRIVTATRERALLIDGLEQRVRRISQCLYDTSVSDEVLEREVTPFLAEDVTFTDPWQSGAGRDTYRRGASVFHLMFKFDFEVFQVNVQLDEAGRGGRAIIDGVMNLRQFDWLYVFPLRTILVYEFRLLDPPKGEVTFEIHAHEEMWSVGDLIAGVPGLGWFYKAIFRKAFSRGFLGAGALVRRLKR